MNHACRGSSLVETMAAVTVATLLSAVWAESLSHQAHRLAEVRALSTALSLARNRLTAASAYPCAPAIPCPPAIACRESRTPLRADLWDSEPLVRIDVEIADSSYPKSPVRLTTIANPVAECE